MASPREAILKTRDISTPFLSALKSALSKVPLMVCVGIFLFHLYAINKYAINLPYMDDWVMFAGDDHPASIDPGWLHGQLNEHRMATTKILIWLQFQLNGWNYKDSLILNLVIFGMLLTCLVWFVRKVTHLVPIWAVLAFMVFLLTPLNWFNHFTALQSSFHFYVLFFFVACSLLFDEGQRRNKLLLACVASVLCIYSLAGGFVSTALLLCAFCVFKALRIYRAVGENDRRHEFFQLILVVGIVGSALAIWTIGYSKPSHHPEIVYPYTLKFWIFFLNLVSLGFGVERVLTVSGIACILIVLVPICGEIWKRRGDLSSAQWASYVAVLGILANLASVSAGRAGFGVSAAKSARYFDFVMPFILLSVVNWAIFLRHRRGLKTGVLICLYLVCAISFVHKWNFDIYRSQSALRSEGARCVEAYYQGVGDGLCPTIYPFSIAPFLEQAKRLNASFYQEMSAEARPQSNRR